VWVNIDVCRSRSVPWVIELINYGFTTLKLDRVVIVCATENHRSRAIPLRLGFTPEGVVRDAEWLYKQFVEHDIYALSVEDWNKS
jgi:ribosomal-protein-serine acetyltransferase